MSEAQMRWVRRVFAFVVLAAANSAWAHALSNAPGDRRLDLWIDAFGIGLLALVAIAYAWGQWRLFRRARGEQRTRAMLFWAGWTSLLIAVASPIDTLSNVSFAMHMIQHEIMMIVAAPLLVLARPLGTLLWGLPAFAASAVKTRALRRTGLWLTAPLVAWILHALVLWGWHVPPAFEAGLHRPPVHWLQHVSFFAAATIYWWSVFSAGAGGERRGVSLLSVFTTAVHTTVLGMLLTFSSKIWYSTYEHTQRLWGFTALEDQQLGGLVMWVPGGMLFLAVGLGLAAQWLKESELRQARG